MIFSEIRFPTTSGRSRIDQLYPSLIPDMYLKAIPPKDRYRGETAHKSWRDSRNSIMVSDALSLSLSRVRPHTSTQIDLYDA